MADSSAARHTLGTRRATMSPKVTTVIVFASILMWSQSPAADGRQLAQTSGTENAPAPTEKAPGRAAGRAVEVKGTVHAVGKANHTVTLKGPKGPPVTLEGRDPHRPDAARAGNTTRPTSI